MLGIEDYVSVETAKTLHEKGYSGMITAATLYEVQMWLRVNHRILVTPYYVADDKYTYHILRMDAGNNYCHNNDLYDSYEEALNAGINEALKLI